MNPSTAPLPGQLKERIGGGQLSSNFIHIEKSTLPRGLTSGQGKIHRNLRLHFDWLAIQNVRFVLPLLHRLDGRWRQHGMTTD